jgi:uncharacterized protein YjbI with pentapeptide repeats
MVWIILIVLPPTLLLWMQFDFLPYQSTFVTWTHTLAVSVDTLLILGLGVWYRLQLCQHRRLIRFAQRALSKDKRTPRCDLAIVMRSKHKPLFLLAVVPVATAFLLSSAANLMRANILGTGEWLTGHTWGLGKPFLLEVPDALLTDTGPENAIDINALRGEFSNNLENGQEKPVPKQREALRDRSAYQRTACSMLEQTSDATIHTGGGRVSLVPRRALDHVIGLNVTARYFVFADLRRTILVRANFFDSDLRFSKLNDAKLMKASLERADLTGASLAYAHLDEAVLDWAVLRDANLQWTRLNGASLLNADLSGADLSSSCLEDVDVNGANLVGANLSGTDMTLIRNDESSPWFKDASIKGIILDFANLSGLILAGIQMPDASLRGADLTGAVVQFSNLRSASMRDAVLKCVEFEGADLTGADLSAADLRDANLRSAELQNSILRGADLRGADLRGANLEFADLTEANLRNADLRGANIDTAELGGAELCGADLRDTEFEHTSQGDH